MPGQSQQLSATAGGVADTNILWMVNGVQGGSAASGTVSATGLYTAPSTVPAGGSVTVTAVSASDSTVSASSAITIEDMVSLSPVSSTVYAGATLQLTATVNGASSSNITWMAGGVAGGNAATGTISTTGLYTAPVTVPSAAVTITAVDAADSLATATAQITVAQSPWVMQAQDQWLAGAAKAASLYGCTAVAVQQQANESVTDAISLFVQTAQEGNCLILAPISMNPNSLIYSYAWGGNVGGIDLYYLSDVSKMRIWNGLDVTGN